MALSKRVNDVMSRFPRHWEAESKGKVFGTLISGLAKELEIKSAQVARVRHAHRLAYAEEIRDLLLVGSLHGFDARHFAIRSRRLEAFDQIAEDLADESNDSAAFQAARKKLSLLLSVSELDLAPKGDDPEPGAPYHDRLAKAIWAELKLKPELKGMSRQLRRLIDIQSRGNTTVAAVLGATAAYLGITLRSISSTDDRSWHIGQCREDIQIALAADPKNGLLAYLYPTVDDYLAIEENPYVSIEIEPIERSHGELFRIDRNGFKEVTVSVRVCGQGERTVQPMVVNVQTGDGVWFNGIVPDGCILEFSNRGTVTLDGEDVTAYAYSFHGGVFADGDNWDLSNDFVFGDAAVSDDDQNDNTATFVRTEPFPDGFRVDRTVPHGQGFIESPTMLVGTTRWRFFIQAAHFGTRKGKPPKEMPAVAINNAGLYDASVYMMTSPGEASGKIGFAWEEQEAFSVVVWIPERFAELDKEGAPSVKDRLRDLLGRYLAVGIKLDVRYTSDTWTLPDGILRDIDSTDVLGIALHGTRLWPDATLQDTDSEPSTQ